MITLAIPPQTLHKAFRAVNTFDLRDLSLSGTGTEVMWLLVPVYAVRGKTPAKQMTDEAPTRIEFAPAAAR